MFRYCDTDGGCISLHDCRAETMGFENGVLSFGFPDGFWVSGRHPLNGSGEAVRTDAAQADFEIIDEEIDGACVYVFRENRRKRVYRETWGGEDFINAVNEGAFQVEFIMAYKGYQSMLFKCWVWFDAPPYHAECEIELHAEKAAYRWNRLRYDRTW